jgi:hypothetical protein
MMNRLLPRFVLLFALAGGLPAQPIPSSQNALRIRNILVGCASPTNGQSFIYNSTTKAWECGSGGGGGDVSTSGSYSNPNWITALAGAKITGTVNAATSANNLAANGGNCGPGEKAGGVNASGVAEDCSAIVTSLGGLTDLKMTRNATTTILNFDTGVVASGVKPVVLPAGSGTLSGSVASGTAYFYLDAANAPTLGHNSAATLTCSNCTMATGITDFPHDSIPLWKWNFTSSVWDATGTDYRPIARRDRVKAGALISIIPDPAGVLEISSLATAGLKSITLFDPVTGDSGRIQFEFPAAVTITSITCSVKAATSATINLDERAQATPDTSGTAVLTSDLACDTDSATSTTFSNASIAANVPVALTISAVSGTPDTLRVHISYTVN